MSPRELLNRWIIPLDRRVDYLALRYGVKFQIPFELMVVFATNLDPASLADEAFLRRIHNKIFVGAVEPAVFDRIFERSASPRGIRFSAGSAAYLRTLCLQAGSKQLRACYPGDILSILEWIGGYEDQVIEASHEALERAVNLYFGETEAFSEEAGASA